MVNILARYYGVHALCRFFARQSFLLQFSPDEIQRSQSNLDMKLKLKVEENSGNKLLNHVFFCSVIACLACLTLAI